MCAYYTWPVAGAGAGGGEGAQQRIFGEGGGGRGFGHAQDDRGALVWCQQPADAPGQTQEEILFPGFLAPAAGLEFIVPLCTGKFR